MNDYPNMTPPPEINDRDAELISAYIDGMLSAEEQAQFEARLQRENSLRRELEAIQRTVNAIHALPVLKAPRDFTLDPSVVRRPDATKKIIDMRPQRRLARTWYPLAMVASLLVVFVGVFAILSNQTSPTAPGNSVEVAALPTNDATEAARSASNLATTDDNPTPDHQMERSFESEATGMAESLPAVAATRTMPGTSALNTGPTQGNVMPGVGRGGGQSGGADGALPADIVPTYIDPLMYDPPPDADDSAGAMNMPVPPVPDADAPGEDDVTTFGFGTDDADDVDDESARTMMQPPVNDEAESEEMAEESADLFAQSAEMADAVEAPTPAPFQRLAQLINTVIELLTAIISNTP